MHGILPVPVCAQVWFASRDAFEQWEQNGSANLLSTGFGEVYSFARHATQSADHLAGQLRWCSYGFLWGYTGFIWLWCITKVVYCQFTSQVLVAEEKQNLAVILVHGAWF